MDEDTIYESYDELEIIEDESSYGTKTEAFLHSEGDKVEIIDFYCKICNKAFKKLHTFREHLNNHLKINKCEHCSRVFPNPGTLNSHKRTHQNERPFGCNSCEKGFKSASDLRRHEISHTQLKLFECVLCKKKYGLKQNLKIHKCKSKVK